MTSKLIILAAVSTLISACASEPHQFSTPIAPFLSEIPAQANGGPDPDYMLASITCRRNLLPARIEQPSKSHAWRVVVRNHNLYAMAFAQSANSVFFRLQSDRLDPVNYNLIVDSDGDASHGELRCSNIKIVPATALAQ